MLQTICITYYSSVVLNAGTLKYQLWCEKYDGRVDITVCLYEQLRFSKDSALLRHTTLPEIRRDVRCDF